MFKRILTVLLIVLYCCFINSPVAVAAGRLNRYVDSKDGYEFLYPNGWVQVKVSGGPDVVFHDLIEVTENVSVVINPTPDDQTLEDLGTPSEVGYRLSKAAIAPPNSGRSAELVTAEAHPVGDQTYYILEYAVSLPNNQKRHNLASAIVRRGQLYTFNISTTEKRWAKIKPAMEEVVNSFKVY